MRVFLNEMELGQKYANVYILRSQSIATTKTEKRYLNFVISDMKGELGCKKWDLPDDFTPTTLETGNFVYCEFIVDEYNGKQQGIAEVIRPISNSDIFNQDELIPVAPENPVELYNELYGIASNFRNEELKKLTTTILEKNKEKLMYWPAAQKMHHYQKGGLIWHLADTVRIAKVLTTIVKCHDELVLAGAMIHDIAKIVEYDLTPIYAVKDYTVKSQLTGGHIILGAFYIEKMCGDLNISGEVKELMESIMLGHHSSAYGPLGNLFIESYIVHVADELSSKAFEYNEALENIDKGTFSDKVWGLENSRIYKIMGDYHSEPQEEETQQDKILNEMI